ncbi:hypothetical protein P8C59_004090 [Phyllachora maydis]|uniref:C2H2-type domain-containing protein n=1 Tax=Phyllachora maydis TaxID=1825666 RepID=A0AAD9MAY8_9PEZI|nr:hypothetical protein P8C59_004090 [Phyllachora maydis]
MLLLLLACCTGLDLGAEMSHKQCVRGLANSDLCASVATQGRGPSSCCHHPSVRPHETHHAVPVARCPTSPVGSWGRQWANMDDMAVDNHHGSPDILGIGSASAATPFDAPSVLAMSPPIPSSLDVLKQQMAPSDRTLGFSTEIVGDGLSYGLAQCFSNSNGPWNPMRAGSGIATGLSGLPPRFTEYNATATFSDTGTIRHDGFSDSGYGTLAQKSVGIPSIYSDVDRSVETLSIFDAISECQIQGVGVDTASTSTREDANQGGHRPNAGKNQSGRSLHGHYCEHCKKNVKTRSELKKHDAKHRKPHHCDVPGCKRTNGFMTVNDLARHQRSVHQAAGIKYRCQLESCRTRDKLWPRADNFRQHLSKVHKRRVDSIAELEPYIDRISSSSASNRSLCNNTLTGGHGKSDAQSTTLARNDDAEDESEDDLDLNASEATLLLACLRRKGMLHKIIKQLGHQQKSKAQRTQHSSESGRPAKSAVKCDHCPKMFARSCELKKHMKRHEKPYGCTFPRCKKSFGSKNDWKRHENSQHYQLEFWRCEEEGKSGVRDNICGKLSHSRDAFRTHLGREHGVTDTALVERQCQEKRLGRNCEARFWCGFCRKTIEVTQRGGGGAWSERFDHIEPHFLGTHGREKKGIKEWVHVDPDLPDLDFPLAPDVDMARLRHQREESPEGLDDNVLEAGLTAGLSSLTACRKRSGDEDASGEEAAKREPRDFEQWHCCSCGSVWDVTSECNAGKFEDQAMLDAHVKKQHTRPFHCVFHFAGCSSTFASKNEWKRHVTCQHLLLHYWLCEEDSCAKQSNSASASQAASPCSGPGSRRSRAAWHATSSSATIPPPNLPEGVWFNRKDLYTQHLRRMHMPPPVKKLLQEAKKSSSSTMASSSASASLSQPVATAPATADPVQEWDFRVKQLQESAKRTRCRLPNEMRCPAVAAGCTEAFSGAEAWDQRMEHVARHLERAAGGEEAAVVFGSGHDTSLLRWAARPDVAVVRLATAEERAAGAQVWLMNDPLQMRVGPEGLDAVGPTSKGDTMGLESGVVAELCVRLSDADRDAEGDSDEDY